MPELPKKRSKKAGLPPGTLIHIGEKKSDETKITIIDYNESYFFENIAETVDNLPALTDESSVRWVNIDTVHQTEIIEKIGNIFKLHPLVQEDILNTDQRPKIDDYGEYIYVVLKNFNYIDKNEEITSEQISLILGKNFVISFQEGFNEDLFRTVRERIKNGKGKIRKKKADYLLYSIIDMIVDNYFLILEKTGDRVELLEEKLIASPSTETLKIIHSLKREIVHLRKSVWPLREVIGKLERRESELIIHGTEIYFRDVYDHTIQIIDTMETYRDIISGMVDIYLSSISNRMNEIMKVLTIITTIFIPLSFIAGIYGMNFKNIPEIRWDWGYPAVLLLMLVCALLMLFYFRKKKWI